MIQWTYENACRCKTLSKVVVATDSDEIAQIISRIDGEVYMTDPDISTGSERVAAVAAQFPDMDIIINLQGDEPFIRPDMLDELVAPYEQDPSILMTTLAYPLTKDKYLSQDSVKVITDINSNALYFSRSPIPYYQTEQEAPVYHHIGLYSFRRDFLLHYQTLPQTPLEKAEALEQLRVLEHGYKIRVCLTDSRTLEINTPAEYEQAQSFEYSL